MGLGEPAWVLTEELFGRLVSSLSDTHERMVGPVSRDGAVCYDEIGRVDDLPRGLRAEQGPGRYRLVADPDAGWFGWAAPSQSLKPWLAPSRSLVASARRVDGRWSIDPDAVADGPTTAIVGARACDLAGREVLEHVLDAADPARVHPEGVGTFVVASACTSVSDSCFCASVGRGPAPAAGFDIVVTELVDGEHRFVAEAGTERGRAALEQIGAVTATDVDRDAARAAVERAADAQTRALDPTGLPGALRAAAESPAWDAVAERCLACGNCTSVCPTCFCSTVEDRTDPHGDTAERWQVWDSCFSLQFTEMHGGSVRTSTASRYRQWLTHKLDTWHDQFGESGCVGCGRCITWCPVGIDLVAEAAAVRAEPGGVPVALGPVG